MIDLGPRISKIKNASRAGYNDKNASRKAAALHGAVVGKTPLNEHGVFDNEDVKLVGKNWPTCHAELHLAHTPVGHWLYKISYSIYQHGSGGRPNIWNRYAYESRDEALRAALDELVLICDEHASGAYPAGFHPYALELRELADKHRITAFQLSLF